MAEKIADQTRTKNKKKKKHQTLSRSSAGDGRP